MVNANVCTIQQAETARNASPSTTTNPGHQPCTKPPTNANSVTVTTTRIPAPSTKLSTTKMEAKTAVSVTTARTTPWVSTASNVWTDITETTLSLYNTRTLVPNVSVIQTVQCMAMSVIKKTLTPPLLATVAVRLMSKVNPVIDASLDSITWIQITLTVARPVTVIN